MSAEIIILPIIRVERPERSSMEEIVTLHLHPRDMARLRRRADLWNLTVVEAAEMLLSDALDPRSSK